MIHRTEWGRGVLAGQCGVWVQLCLHNTGCVGVLQILTLQCNISTVATLVFARHPDTALCAHYIHIGVNKAVCCLCCNYKCICSIIHMLG